MLDRIFQGQRHHLQAHNAKHYPPESSRIRLFPGCHQACGEYRIKDRQSHIMSSVHSNSPFQLTGKQFQRLRQFQDLPNLAYTCSTVGWYQGSAYVILTGSMLLSLEKQFSN